MAKDSDLLQDVMLLSRAAQLVLQDEVLASLRDSEIGATKMNILRLVRRQQRQSVNDLARFLGQTKAASSQNVDSLVKAGLVRRDPDEDDRRCVWISLTPRGRRLLLRAEKRQAEVLEKAVAGMPESARRKASIQLRSLAMAMLEVSANKGGNCLQCCAYNSSSCVYEEDAWRCAYKSRRQGPAA